MDDTNVLERLVADEMVRRAGPEPVVDDAAIFTAITTTQSPKWRLQSMFSATKFVVAGAIVALFGGFLLIAQPFEEQGASVPGAATDDGPMAPVYVKMNFLEQYGSYGTEFETNEGMTGMEGGVLGGGADSTDPRLSTGPDGFLVTDVELYIDGETEIETQGIVIYNDGGRWVGTGIGGQIGISGSIGTSPLDADGDFSTVMLSGMEGYEGLTALLWDLDDRSEWELGGLIFEGDMPAMPGDWCALARDDFPAAVTRFGDDPGAVPTEYQIRQACPSVEIPDQLRRGLPSVPES